MCKSVMIFLMWVRLSLSDWRCRYVSVSVCVHIKRNFLYTFYIRNLGQRGSAPSYSGHLITLFRGYFTIVFRGGAEGG